MEEKKISIEERYIKAFEDFCKEQYAKGVKPESDEMGKALMKAEKDVRVGMYLSQYGANALTCFKNDVSKMDKNGESKFDYNKLNAVQKEIYSSLNYIQSTKDRDRRLKEGVEKLMNGEEYAKFLEFNSRFHHYSFNNQLLIFVQKPDATYVAGLGTWKKDFAAGGINQGEKGIAVSRPNVREFTEKDKLDAFLDDPKHAIYYTEQEKSRIRDKFDADGKVTLVTSFSFTYVWDVSQLHDKEGNRLKLNVPEIRKQIGKDFEDFAMVKEALTASSPVAITYCKDISEDSDLKHAYGYYRPSTDTITVRDAGFKDKDEVRSEQDCIKTIIHEIAHSMLHGKEMRVEGIDNTSLLDKSQKEVEAESVAFMVCDHLGIDSSCNSFGYLASYLPNDAEARYKALEKSMKRINDCAGTIIEKLDKELERIAEERKNMPKVIEAENAAQLMDAISMIGSLQDIVYDLMEGVDMDEELDLYDSLNDSAETLSDYLDKAKKGDIDLDMLAADLADVLYTIEEDVEAAEPDYVDTLNDNFDYDTVMEQAHSFCDEHEMDEIERD